MNDKSLTTLTPMKYPKGTRLIAHDQFEAHPDGVIIGYTADGRYKCDVLGEMFDATDWYLENYFSLYSPEGVPYNYGL